LGKRKKTSLLVPKSSRLKRIEEVSSKTFQKQRGANRCVPKLLRNNEEQTEAFVNFRSQGGQTKEFLAFQETGMKTIEQVVFQAFQVQRITNRGIPKLFRSEEEQTKLCQYFPGPKWNYSN